nr:golgin subfamily A member 6-like protein 4 [Drosophila takahashii]
MVMHTPLSNQAMPRRASASRFVPSTAERAIPPHTDKKWVAERSHQILEYLHAIHQSEAAAGFISDLSSRPGGLRNMTMKQFVAILNLLFQNIWRNRVTVVGQNHVEDITSAMQKLQYPYQVNKSWLVSPTTQHSFGHVIVLLDFLLDFAPPPFPTEEEDFPFMETTEQPSCSYLNSMHCASMAELDEEVNALLFAAVGDCIVLWDQELGEEEAKLQAETGDRLISRKCHLPHRQALDQLIDELRLKLQQLDVELGSSNDLELLMEEQQQLAQQLAHSQADLSQQLKNLDNLGAQAAEKQSNLRQLIEDEQRLAEAVKSQKYSAQELKALQMKCHDAENYSKAYSRQLQEVADLEMHQRVSVSHSWAKLLKSVEAFNSHARHLSMDPVLAAGQKLELTLPMSPNQEQISERVQRLELLANLLQQQGEQNIERRLTFDQQEDQLKRATIELEGEIATLESQLQQQEHRLTKMEEENRNRRNLMTQQQLLEDQSDQIGRLEELERRRQAAQERLHTSEQKNEDLLAAAELQQEEDHKARNAQLDKCELKLIEGEKELQALHTKLTLNQAKLDEEEQKVHSARLPSFEPVLAAIKKRYFKFNK